MAGWRKYFKPTNSVLPSRSTYAGRNTALDKFSSWLPEIYQGPPNRLQRYAQYDQMDYDHEVHAALDTIAEFSTHPDDDTGLPFNIIYNDDPSEQQVTILKKALRQWCKSNEFNKRAFKIFRSAVKYGDQVFIRDPETYKLIWVDPQTVERVVVNESEGKEIEVYYIKNLDLNLQMLTGTDTTKKTAGGYGSSDSILPNAPLTGQANFLHGNAHPSMTNAGTYGGNEVTFPVDAKHVVHLSLTDGMDDAWPFGVSILEKVYKVYKQKELLEDAIIIYRVHRAPERRVFMIDVGTMPPEKAQQYLERIRYEVQQKRIPSRTGGGDNIMDSAYNPLSMLEDYFFAQTPEGRGSSVTTLQGGENLGEIDDLKYWNNKMFRALGIPSSYLPTGPDDGTAQFNDGKIGSAFIQEFRFTRYCKRLQRQLIDPLDREFKMYLKHRGINIDSSLFEVEFNQPQNFQEFRQIEIDAAFANVFGQLADVPYMSKRYLLSRYLGWSEDEIVKNEAMYIEEQTDLEGVDDMTGSGAHGGLGGMGGATLSDVGVNAGGFDDFGDVDDMEDIDDGSIETGDMDIGTDTGGEEV
jgi:hypothetical protein